MPSNPDPHATAGKDCIFCHLDREILAENEFAVAVYDRFPVSPGHSLVIPRRHAMMIWDLTDEEYDACFRLVRTLKPALEARHKPDGFNVGVNCGATAGQSVWHAHIHVIPRFPGDSADPLGGVRHVIPRKAPEKGS